MEFFRDNRVHQIQQPTNIASFLAIRHWKMYQIFDAVPLTSTI